VLQKIELALAQAAEPRDPKREDIALQLAKHAERRLAVLEADRAIAEVEHQIAEAREASKPAARIDPFEKKLAMARADRDKAIAEARESKSTVTPIAPAYPANSSGRRLALAGWISNRDNPLTARVLVNHVWMRHMGRPLVESVFDFGHHGTGPSHQELLDHLAVEFMDHGWSLKWLHRTILTSDAYRRASHVAEDHSAIALDPDNRWYWRANDRRLEAELVRDNVLWVASLLDESPGGPDLDENKAMEIPRRSLYFRHAPEKNAEFLKLFDAANPAACYRREVSIIPQQALALANSTISLDSARVLAGRLSAETGENDHAFLIAAFETLLGRAPGSSELETCREYLARMTASLKRDASGWTRFTDGPTPRSSPSANPSQRAREDLVHVLLNHHDFVTIP
jgi:hypothetical protein